jgi:hypothetical protein
MEHYIFEVLKHIYDNHNSKATYLDDKYDWNSIYYNTSYKKIMWDTGDDFILTDKFLTSTKIDWKFEVFDIKEHEIEQELLKYVNKQLNEKFDKYDEICWYNIYEFETLTEEFIEKTMNCLDSEDKWKYVFMYNSVSEDFIRKHMNDKGFDNCVWGIISLYQELSEDFIREFQDKLNLENISVSQKISDEFILDFFDRLDWWNIIRYNLLPFQTISKYVHRFNDDIIQLIMSHYPESIEVFKKLITSEK